MKLLLQKRLSYLFTTKINLIRSFLSSFSATTSFVEKFIKTFAISILLCLTNLVVLAQWIKLDTIRAKGTKVIEPNFENLQTLMWNGFKDMIIVSSLKDYGYLRSPKNGNIYNAKGTFGKYFIEIWEDDKNEYVRIVAVIPNYDWNPWKGFVVDDVKEQYIDGWRCFIQKPDYNKGHFVYAERPPKDDTLEVSAVYVKP